MPNRLQFRQLDGKGGVDILVRKSIIICIWLILSTAGAYGQVEMPVSSVPVEQYNRPIDADLYLVRPGDTLRVVFIGTQVNDLFLVVDAEGQIVHRELGKHAVGGLSLSGVRRKLESELENLYSNSRIEISVGTPRLVSISVAGWVESPGVYRAFTSQTISHVIELAGGIKDRGSSRRIEFSGGPVPIMADLEKALFLGDYTGDPNLYGGISVYVPEKSGREVSVVGNVQNSRAIELVEGDNLIDLISIAGGVTDEGDISLAYVLGDSLRDLTQPGAVHAGDIIVVPPKQSRKETVSIKGAVKRPGLFEYRHGMTLADALDSAGDISADANDARITILRRDRGNLWSPSPNETYPVSSTGKRDIALMPGDVVIVPSYVGFVQVSGRVRRPGLYPYTPGRDVWHYIELSGGISNGGIAVLMVYDRVSQMTVTVQSGSLVFDGDKIIVGETAGAGQ